MTGPSASDVRQETLEDAVSTLGRRGLTLAVMESCTGGLLSATITSVPGAGQCFVGGVVSYATEAKKLMGVEPAVIEAYGVVSRETAEAMARAICEQFETDIGIGLTGVAGPAPQDGVPVGTVYVAVCRRAENSSTLLKRCDFTGEPDEIKRQAVEVALELLAVALVD